MNICGYVRFSYRVARTKQEKCKWRLPPPPTRRCVYELRWVVCSPWCRVRWSSPAHSSATASSTGWCTNKTTLTSSWSQSSIAKEYTEDGGMVCDGTCLKFDVICVCVPRLLWVQSLCVYQTLIFKNLFKKIDSKNCIFLRIIWLLANGSEIARCFSGKRDDFSA